MIFLKKKTTIIILILILAMLNGCFQKDKNDNDPQINISLMENSIEAVPIPCGPEASTGKEFDKMYHDWFLRSIIQPFEKSDMSMPGKLAELSFLKEVYRFEARYEPYKDPLELEQKAKELIDNGSTNPLIFSNYGRLLIFNDTNEDVEVYLQKAQKGICEKNLIPSIYNNIALLSANDDSGDRKELGLNELKSKAIELLACAIRNGEFRRSESRIAYYVADLIPIKSTYKWKTLKDLIEDDKNVDPWLISMFAGRNAIELAWTYRGGGVASTVESKDWEEFYSYLKEADKHLTGAWEIYPEYPEAASNMITVIMGGDNSFGETERFWFDRAVEAQMDYAPAYESFLLSMMPRWGGSHDLMEAFGIECLETARFDTDVPLFYLYTLREIAGDQPNNRWREIFRKPGISENLDRLFDGLIKEPVRSAQKRRILAQKALCNIWSGKYSEAKDIINSIDEKPDVRRGFSYKALSWSSRSWDIVDAEIRLFTGPHKQKLEDAQSFLAENDIDNAIALLKDVLPAYKADGFARAYLLRRMALMQLSFERGGWQYAPMHFAAMENLTSFARYLISINEPVDPRSKNNMTPLHFACRYGHVDMVSLLLSNGADIDAIDNYGYNALHFAVKRRHPEIAELLIKKEINVNCLDIYHWTPLHSALFDGQSNIAEKIIYAGANINILNDQAWSPLLLALRYASGDVGKRLIEMGANINVVSLENWSPLHMALFYDKPETAKILIEQGAEINVLNNDRISSLHIALYKKYSELSCMLIEKGSNINVVDTYGQLPIHYAIEMNLPEAAKKLIEKGSDLNRKNSNGLTPLHLAVMVRNAQIVNLLLKNGANPQIKSPKGKTPVDYANDINNKQLISLFNVM